MLGEPTSRRWSAQLFFHEMCTGRATNNKGNVTS